VTVFHPDVTWTCRRQDSVSKSQNHPFDGWTMMGKAMAAIVAGQIAWKDKSLSSRATASVY